MDFDILCKNGLIRNIRDSDQRSYNQLKQLPENIPEFECILWSLGVFSWTPMWFQHCYKEQEQLSDIPRNHGD